MYGDITKFYLKFKKIYYENIFHILGMFAVASELEFNKLIKILAKNKISLIELKDFLKVSLVNEITN